MKEQLLAIIPYIPQMLEAGKSIWDLMIKPILKQTGCNLSKEQEQDLLNKENNKDLIGIISFIEELANSIKPNITNQTYIGDNGNVNNFQNVENVYQNVYNQPHENKPKKLSDKADIILSDLYNNEFRTLQVRQEIGGLFSINANHIELGSIKPDEVVICKNAIKELLENEYIYLVKKGKEELTGRYEMSIYGQNYLKNKS